MKTKEERAAFMLGIIVGMVGYAIFVFAALAYELNRIGG